MTISRTMRLLVAALVVGVLGAFGGFAQNANAAQRQVALGVSVLPWDSISSVDSFSHSVGHAPATWTIWNDWGGPHSAFPSNGFLNGLYNRGITPMVFWQPTDPTSSQLGKYAYLKIKRGDFDTYIRNWAAKAKAWGHPLILRFAHEMDGHWFPWSMNMYGNTPKRFVKAWRHVWNIFHSVGATNVRFLWSPLNPCGCRADLFPGDKYVAYVGFTALNWGDYKGQWRSLRTIVKSRMKKVHRLTNKPVIVAELASSAAGGSKATWLTKGYSEVYAKFPQIQGLIYFNVDMTHIAQQPDWRLQIPTSALTAYRQLVVQSRFQGQLK